MKTVGAFDAKTHLNQLLQKTAKGETIHITRRGVPVARLMPPERQAQEDVCGLVTDIRRLRKGASLGKTSIRELIDEGRRF